MKLPRADFLKKHSVFLAAFGALYLVFLYPLFGTQKGFSVGDYGAQFYPWAWIYASALKAGQWLLWTPMIHSGFPLFAEGQTATLYFPNLFFFGLFPFRWAYNLLFLSHFALAGIGAYRLGLKIGQSREAATLTSLCFTFGSAAGGSFYGLFGFRGLAWFPWALALTEDLAVKPSKRRAVFWLALVQAQAWLTGAQMALYQAGFLALYYFLRSAARPMANRFRRAAWFIGGILLSILIASSQIWATLEWASQSTRVLQNPDFILWGSWAPWSLCVLFFYTWNNIFKSSLYIGALPLLWTVTHFSWRRQGLWWKLVFFSFFMALGRFNPLYWLFLKLELPVFSLLRNPSKFLFFAAFFLCVIAGYSLDAWLDAGKKKAAIFFMLILAFVGSSACFLVRWGGDFLKSFGQWYTQNFVLGKSYHKAPAAKYLTEGLDGILTVLKRDISFSSLSFWLPLVMLGAGLVVLHFLRTKKVRPATLAGTALFLVCLDFFIYSKLAGGVSWKDIGKLEEPADRVAYATDGKWLNIGPSRYEKLRPNRNLMAGVAHPGAYSPLLQKDYYLLTQDFGAMDDSFGPSVLNREALKNALEEKKPLVDFLGIRYVLAGPQDRLPSYRLEGRTADETFYVNDEAQPEFTFEANQKGEASSVTILQNKASRAEIEIKSPGGGVLLRHQIFDKGWKVWVDGREEVLQKSHGIFQGVPLAPGEHRLRFSFEPLYWTWGRWLSLAALLVAVAGLFLSGRPKDASC